MKSVFITPPRSAFSKGEEWNAPSFEKEGLVEDFSTHCE